MALQNTMLSSLLKYRINLIFQPLKNLNTSFTSLTINQVNQSTGGFTCWRSSHTFLGRLNADQLWKSTTSVSSAGRRKGRGKGSSKKLIRDLNRGQVIGFGKKNMLWPGLNAPIIQGREVLRQQELPPDENREKRLIELRDKMASRKFPKIHPLERGWSGTSLPGRSLGPPDAYGEENVFDGFDSRVLEFKPIMQMTSQRGRVRSLSALVVVGNKNGLAGFAKARSANGMGAAKAAKNKAAKALRYIKRDNNTIIHDFCGEFGGVKVFVKKKPEGYGLVCHRVVKAICEMIGIKNLHAKVEGNTSNYQCLTKAFFIGLMKQKTLQQIADEKGLHVIEKRADRDHYPQVVASPAQCRAEHEIPPTERREFLLHVHGGKVEQYRKPFQPFYVNFPSYIKEMKDRERFRNTKGVRVRLIAKYGKLASFLTERAEEEERERVKQTVEE